MRAQEFIVEALDFMEGDCPIMAIALHRLTGLPLMALVEHNQGETYLMHAYVGVNDKWRLDAEGLGTAAWYKKQFPYDEINGQVEEVTLTEKELLRLGYEADQTQCPTLSQVLPIAKEVIAAAKEDLQDAGVTLDEDWRHVVTGLGAASMLAGGGGAAYDAYKAQQTKDPQSHVQQVQTPQPKVQAPRAQPQVSQAQAVSHAQDLLATKGAQILQKAAKASGLKGNELAQFMAQCAHETANFTTLKELGDKNYFKKYDIKFNPEKAKALGNLRPGDGELYKGRGFIQLTGRYNYKKAGEALGLPLEKNPRLVERPDVAAKVALWFWKNRVQPNVSNFQDTQQATKPINPGLKGLSDRHNKYVGMKVATAKPAQPAKVAAKPVKGKKT